MAQKVTRELEYLIKTYGQEKVIGSLNKINDGLKTTKSEIDRANKSVGGFAKNSTSSFAKQAQGLGGLVHVYATVAANVFALSAAFLVLKNNADLRILEESSAKLSDATGKNYFQVANNMKQITNGALSIADSMRQANLALSGGLSATQLEEITGIATKAAAATGRSVEESVQRMIQAVVKGEPELVDEFGIILRIGKAVEDYALAHNKAASSLTTFERQQAIATQAIERGNKTYGALKTEEIANQFELLQTKIGELARTVLSFISGPMEGLAGFLKDNSSVLLAGMALFVRFIIKAAIPSINDFGKRFTENSVKVSEASIAMAKVYRDQKLRIIEDNGHILRSNKEIATSLRKIARTPGVALGTTLKKTSRKKGGASDKELIDSITTDLKGKYKNVVTQIITQLDDFTAESIKTDIGTFTRQQAQDQINALNKLEYKAGQTGIAIAKDVAASKAKLFVLNTQLYAKELQKRAALYKAYITSGLAKGSEAGFLGAIKLGTASKKELAEKGANKVTQNISKVSTIAGGLFSTITKIGSKLIGWGFAISIFLSVLDPILNFLGLMSQKVTDARNSTEEIIESNKELEKSLEKTNKIIEEEELTLRRTTVTLNRHISATKTIADNLKQMKKNAEAMEETTWFQTLFGGDTAKNNEITALQNQIDAMKKLGAVLGNVSGAYDKRTKKAIVERLEARKTAAETGKSYEDLIVNLENKTATIDLSKPIKEQLDALDLAHEEWQQFFASITEGVEKQNKELSDLFLSIQSGTKSISATFTSVNESLQKELSPSKIGGPYASYLAQLSGAGNEVKALVRAVSNENIEASKRAEEALDTLFSTENIPKNLADIFGIKSALDLRNVVEQLTKQQREYYTNSLNIAASEARIKILSTETSKGNIESIGKEYALQRKVAKLKAAQLNAEIFLQDKIIKSSSVSEETRENARLAKNLSIIQQNALLEEANDKYSEQRQIIAEINKAAELRKLAEAKTLVVLNQQKNIASIISNNKTLSEEERIKAEINRLDYEISINNTKAAMARKSIVDIDNKLIQLAGEELKDRKLILDLEAERLKLSGIISEAEYKNGEARRKSLNTEIDIMTEGKQLEIKSLEAQLSVLKSISDISERISSDNRISSIERQAALIKSNVLLKQAFDLELTTSKLREAAAKSSYDKLKNNPNADPSKTLQAQIDFEKERTIQLGLQAEARERNLNYAEDLFELQKKEVELSKFFEKPEETMEMVRKEFALSAAEFAEQMITPIDRFVETLNSTIDNTVDAFVDAAMEGGDILQASSDAIRDTLNDAATNYTKDILKKLSRDLIVKLTSPEFFGKSQEEILVAEQQQTNIILREISNKLSMSPIEQSKEMANVLGAFGNDLATKPGSSTEFDIFDKVPFEDITAEGIKASTAATTAIAETQQKSVSIMENLANGMMNFGSDISGWVQQALSAIAASSATGSGGGGDIFSSLFGMFGSSSGGDVSAAGNTGSEMFAEFAKGGITGELNRYATGAITNGPELALIGEGKNREAVVPLPDNRSIPVDLGDQTKQSSPINISINITGVEGNEQGLNRSANQIGARVGRAVQQAQRRNG